jgi:hypothetical protein
MSKKNADGVPETFKSFIQKAKFERERRDLFKMFNLMTPLITTFGMGSTLFNIE